jgi:hypothetical protein
MADWLRGLLDPEDDEATAPAAPSGLLGPTEPPQNTAADMAARRRQYIAAVLAGDRQESRRLWAASIRPAPESGGPADAGYRIPISPELMPADPVEALRQSLPERPVPGGQVLTNRDPSVTDGVPSIFGGRDHPVSTPEQNDRAMAEATLALNFSGGIRGVRRAPSPLPGRSSVGSGQIIRYNVGDDPVPSAARPAAPNAVGADAPPSASAAPPRATVDPEGRHLTAPRIFGRDANGAFLARSPGDVGSLLDDLAGAGVQRGVPTSDLPRNTRGEAIVSNLLLGKGERARAAARVRIHADEPFGGGVEAHEAGHLIHFIRDGASRLTSRSEAELARIFSGGPYEQGSQRYRDELYANGI